MTARKTVVLPRSLRPALLAHARECAPAEACGLLVGAGRFVSFAVATPNRARRQTEYLVDPRTHIDLRRLLRKSAPRQSIIGVYHSHPFGPARPSPADLARAEYPDWVHVIVAPRRRPAVRAFRIVGGRAKSVVVRWVG